MKVFISWSGTHSHELACALRDWLPLVLQALKPFLSSADIDRGARWSTEIARELQGSSFGILCVTPDNRHAPWLLFEAGALSKNIESSRVMPLLFGMRPGDVDGPLATFQCSEFGRPEMLQVLQVLNDQIEENMRLPQANLERSLSTWWKQLEEKVAAIMASHGGSHSKPSKKRPQDDQIEEMLGLLREQQRRLGAIEQHLAVGSSHIVPSKAYFETARVNNFVPLYVKGKPDDDNPLGWTVASADQLDLGPNSGLQIIEFSDGKAKFKPLTPGKVGSSRVAFSQASSNKAEGSARKKPSAPIKEKK